MVRIWTSFRAGEIHGDDERGPKPYDYTVRSWRGFLVSSAILEAVHLFLEDNILDLSICW